MGIDLDNILTFTVALAYRAGNIILQGSEEILQSHSDVSEKSNSVDLVTEYDVKVEELVFQEIKKSYPTFEFIGEESYAAGSRATLTDDPTFCVDPIDGTTNFVHGFPFVCISIGLIYKRSPILGVVYNPFLDQMWTAIKGKGAYLTRNRSIPQKLPLTAKPLLSLSDAQIAVEWGNDRSTIPASSRASSFHRLASEDGKMVHSLRSTGSSVLNFVLVAQGALDLYWELGCYPWDVCAGIIIAQEAGALVCGGHDTFNATSSLPEFGYVGEGILMGRKYIVVRGIMDLDVQKRLMKEFFDTVDNYTVKGLT